MLEFVCQRIFFFFLFHNNTVERMYTEPCMTIDTADIAACNSADYICLCASLYVCVCTHRFIV